MHFAKMMKIKIHNNNKTKINNHLNLKKIHFIIIKNIYQNNLIQEIPQNFQKNKLIKVYIKTLLYLHFQRIS